MTFAVCESLLGRAVERNSQTKPGYASVRWKISTLKPTSSVVNLGHVVAAPA